MVDKKIFTIALLLLAGIAPISACSSGKSDISASLESANANTVTVQSENDCEAARGLYEEIVLEKPASFTAAWELNILTYSKIVVTASECFSLEQIEQANRVIDSHEKNFQGK